MKPFNVVLALLPLLLVTGCVTRTVREKQAQVCASLATLNSAVILVRRVGSSSTVGSLKQAEDRVSAAFRDVKASVQDMRGVNIDELEKAYDELNKAVKEIPDESTITEALPSLSSKVATLESALVRTQSGLRCPER